MSKGKTAGLVAKSAGAASLFSDSDGLDSFCRDLGVYLCIGWVMRETTIEVTSKIAIDGPPAEDSTRFHLLVAMPP